MHNLLEEPLIRVRLTDATTRPMSLPEVYDAMSAERVSSFPALRPHQRHAWHAFLAQLGTVALQCAGHEKLPSTGLDWPALLRNLTPAFGSDEPWCLIAEDPAHPAFMQCPAPNGFDAYRGRAVTPDDLDILVTAKNHDLKRTVAAANAPDDWIFALIDLQTMAGFLGAGNYGIARMNGGFSARPCLGLAPAEGGPGSASIPRYRPNARRAGCSVERLLGLLRPGSRIGADLDGALGWHEFARSAPLGPVLHRDMPPRTATR